MIAYSLTILEKKNNKPFDSHFFFYKPISERKISTTYQNFNYRLQLFPGRRRYIQSEGDKWKFFFWKVEILSRLLRIFKCNEMSKANLMFTVVICQEIQVYEKNQLKIVSLIYVTDLICLFRVVTTEATSIKRIFFKVFKLK